MEKELKCWDFLKESCEIWCINLRNRPDKLEYVKNQFKKIGLLYLVNFHITDKYMGDIPQKGCWDSHKFCMEHAYKNNKNVLIFEDDVYFIDNWYDSYESIKNTYISNNWDILRLGTFVFKYDTEIDNNLWCGEFNASHALFIKKNYIKLCLDDINFCAENYHLNGIDEYYRFECKRNYTIIPMIAYQNTFDTDNIWYPNYNLWQNIWQCKYLYLYNQYFMNKISWILRNRNDVIKKCNPYVLLFNLSDKILIYLTKK